SGVVAVFDFSASLSFATSAPLRHLPSFPTRRSSDLFHDLRSCRLASRNALNSASNDSSVLAALRARWRKRSYGSKRRLLPRSGRSEEHTSELQSRRDLVCRLLLEKKKNKNVTRSRIR